MATASDDALLFSAVHKIGLYYLARKKAEEVLLVLSDAEVFALWDEFPVPLKLAAWKVHNDEEMWITLNLPPETK